VSDEKRSEDEKDAVETPAGEEPRTEADVDEAEDAANPAAIARRVAALGADDASEALAREEEQKLAERRAATKKKGTKKKSGLEVAASKKLEGIGKRAEPTRRNVAVASDADPLIERTAKLSEWAKRNQKTVQLVGVLLCVALAGVAFTLWRDAKRETEASQILTKAVEVQQAQIGEPKKTDEDDEARAQTFKTYDARREAALKQYREVETKFPKTGAAILARLAEASLLLDQRDAAGALAAYTEVKDSPLAAADLEVKGRALEGIGFAHELKAIATPAEKDKELEAALAAYKELENTADVKGFKELAMYHQARVLMNKGEKDKAKELLLSVKERVTRVDDPISIGMPVPPSFPYLKEVALDRLRELDPNSAPKALPPHGGPPGAGGSPDIEKLLEQLKKKGGVPGAPGAPKGGGH
jgi:predicted negative regulator of RcsB-dependent stress response